MPDDWEGKLRAWRKVMAAYRRVYDMSLWAWWEVVAAHHRVHDYACCHLQADCLESGISSGAIRSMTSMGNVYLYLQLLKPETTDATSGNHELPLSQLLLLKLYANGKVYKNIKLYTSTFDLIRESEPFFTKVQFIKTLDSATTQEYIGAFLQ